MDHKIVQPKKEKSAGCLVGILVFLLVIVAGAAVLMYFYEQRQVTAAENVLTSGDIATTKILLGPLDVTIDNITGTVRSNQSVTLNWKTSGTVADVNVEIGDSVLKDQVLASLDISTLDQDVLNARLDLQDAQDDYDELVENETALSNALAAVVTGQKNLEDAQKSLDSMDMSRVSENEILIARENYQKAEIAYNESVQKFELTRQYDLNSSAREKRLGDVSGYRSLRDTSLSVYAYYLGNVDNLELQIREGSVLLAKALLDDAQYAHEKLLKGPTNAQLDAAQAKIDAVQNILDSSKIIAPFNGTVTQMGAKIGDVIAYDSQTTVRNKTALRIDDLSTLYIDFTVSELNINYLKENQATQITFDAIPNKKYHGVITNVSDSGIKSGTSVSFAITAAMSDPDEQVKAGMTASLTIPVERRENVMIVPISAVFTDGDGYELNRKNQDGQFKRIAVTLGSMTRSTVEIISDEIKAGDEIQLSTTVKTDSMQNFFFMGLPSPGGGGGGNRPPGGGG